MLNVIKRVMVLPMAAAFCLLATQAQQVPPPTNPTSPAGAQNNGQAGPGSTTSGETPTSPVATPAVVVTGGLAPTVVENALANSQLQIGFQVGAEAASNLEFLGNLTGWQPILNFGGHMYLQKSTSNSQLTLRYTGGGVIYPSASGFNNSYQQIEANEAIEFRRWVLTLDDLFGYYPQSSFGYPANGVAGSLGTTSVDQSLEPNQSIFTPYGERISNTALVQVQAEVSARTSFTFTGDSALIHYFQAGYGDSLSDGFSAGYNYLLNARDTIGVSYQFGYTQFELAGTAATQSTMNNNTVLVNYGHHVAGRYSLQAGIGPQIVDYTLSGAPAAIRSVSWSANAAITYQHERTSLGLNFFRGVSAGAGILVGATTNAVTFSVARPIGRFWTLNGTFGYALNEAIAGAPGTTGNYNSLYGSAGIVRNLGPTMTLSANYSLQHQTIANASCTGVICASQFTTNIIAVNFGWNLHPIPIE